MAHDSRLTDEKEQEFNRRLFKAISESDFDEVQRIEQEREALEKSAPPAQSPTASSPIEEDDDVYIPEPIKKPAFEDDEDDEPIDDKVTNPLEGLNLSKDTSDEPAEDTASQPETSSPDQETAPQENPEPEPQAKQEAPQPTPQENTVDSKFQDLDETNPPTTAQGTDAIPADKASTPTTALDWDDDEDDELEEPNQKLTDKFKTWLAQDDKNKWIATIGALAVVLLIILGLIAVTSGGKKEEPAPQQPQPAQQQEEQPENDNQSAADIPGNLAPVNVEASCANDDSDPAAMFTPDESKAWVCQRAMGIDGVPVTIDLGTESTISSVSIVPGFNHVEPRGEDQWTNHRVVTKALWEFDDNNKTRLIQDIVPSKSAAQLDVPDVHARTVTLTIMQTQPADEAAPQPAPGSEEDTFAVSNVTITGSGK